MIQYPAIFNSTQTIVHTIASTHVEQDYQIFVSLPRSYAETDKKFPVLYLTDGNMTFTFVKPIIELQQIVEQVPELIIVGIGYPMTTYMDTLTVRTRDLTPFEMTPEQKAASDYPYGETGGASRFYAFLAHELIPWVEREFRAAADDRALGGFSSGASFAWYTVFQQPALFKRVIAVSPDSSHFTETEQVYASTNSALPVKLYSCVESSSDDPEIVQMIEQEQRFASVIQGRNYAGFDMTFQIFEGIDHFSVGPIGFTYGLREIYR